MRDPQTMVDSCEKFELQKGLAGFVTVAGHTIISESIRTDGRFVKEIDDPNGAPDSALQIISSPLNSHTDSELMSRGDTEAAIPRAIVQLINRRSGFEEFAADIQDGDVKDLLRASVKFD